MGGQKKCRFPFKNGAQVLSLHSLKKKQDISVLFFRKGVISSVGLERCFDRAEVTGSNPVSPTARASAIRDVAQPGRVHVWGACGRRFKSCHPDLPLPKYLVVRCLGFFI